MIARLLARRDARRHAARQSAIDLDIALANTATTTNRQGGTVPARWVGPSRAQVRAAIITTARLGAADLMVPAVVDRVTDAVMATLRPDPLCDALRADMAADPDLADQYATRFRRDGTHGLTGPHERDDRWLAFADGEHGDVPTIRTAWTDAHTDLTDGTRAYDGQEDER